MIKGTDCVAFETKVLLIALSKIVQKASSPEEIYETLKEMASVEGIELEPFVGEDGKDSTANTRKG